MADREHDDEASLAPREPKGDPTAEDEPPIVARMVIEIRSDGRRTVARGALEDRISGQTVAVHADAASPLALARQLAGALWRLPTLTRTALRALRPTRRGR